MTLRQRVLTLDARLASSVATQTSASWPRRAAGAVHIAEIAGSLRFAKIVIAERDVAELASVGRTPAGASLEACNAVADYAAAAAHVALTGRRRRRLPILRLEEIVNLHALATRRSTSDRPGKWRTATAAAQRSGAVPPPAWLIPRDVAALVERFAGGPPPDRAVLPWLADFHARFRRITPFATANGRVGRLCLNLILARLRYPPLVLARNAGPRFAAALDDAAAGDLWPSALFLGHSLERTLLELGDAREPQDGILLRLGDLAEQSERAALYKAAQRGRLRTVRKGTSIFTTKVWLHNYRSSRAAAGRPPVRPLTD